MNSLLIAFGYLSVHCHSASVASNLLDIPEIHRLESMVHESYLTEHSLLQCFENGDFANMTEAASIFAMNHYVYSNNFINYLETVAFKIDDDTVRDPILHNIKEELGNYDQDDIDMLANISIAEEWYNQIQHKDLFRRFLESLGMDPVQIPLIHIDDHIQMKDTDSPGEIFTKYMIQMYRDSNVCESLAIIGFAIEETVSKLYQYIWNGLRLHTALTDDQIVFFPLHIVVDDGHADLLKLSFKHYLLNNYTMCQNAEESIAKVLDKRTWMYNEVRKHIEQTQQYECKIPYNYQSDEVHTDEAVREAQVQTLKYNALSDPTWSLQQKMSLAARILAKQGHGETLSGQITCRYDGIENENDTDAFEMLVNVYGKPIELVTPDDFLVIDDDLNVIDGDGFANKATRFHVHVYKKRPDIQCAVHTHPLAVSALSLTGHELFVSHMDVMAFYEDVQYLSHWPGIPFGDEEGDIISGLLSDGYWSALLGHHGLIVGGRSIEEATYRAYFLERAARMQLDAMAAVGGDVNRLKRTDPELSRKARDWRISEGPVKAHFNGWAHIILNENAPF